MVNQMNEGKLYLVKLVSNEVVLGEFDGENLINCVNLNMSIDNNRQIHYDLSPPFVYFNDLELYSIENIKGKSIFIKELSELEPLNKGYFDFRMSRLNTISKNNSNLIIN